MKKKTSKSFEINLNIDKNSSKNHEKQNLKNNQQDFKNDDEKNKTSKLALEKSSKSVKTISITKALNNETKNTEEEVIKCKRNSNFSESKMLDVWSEMIDYLKQKGKVNLSIILDSYKPILKSNFLIELNLSNTSQLEIFIEEKYMLLDYLKDKLNNDIIDIDTIIVEQEKKDLVYTNKDKFKKMLQKNSSLVTLQKKIGLDPDY